MSAAPVRALSPKDFSRRLAEFGVHRSERWVRDECAAGRIRTLPAFGRHEIPESELRRLLTPAEACA